MCKEYSRTNDSMQSIQDAVGHFGQAARLIEEGMSRFTEVWAQMERSQLAQRSAEERWHQMEESLGTVMETRWRQLQERLEMMMMERVEALVQERLEGLVIEAVEAKVGARLEDVEQKMRERDGDRETGETSPNVPKEGFVTCETHHRITEMDRGNGDILPKRLAILEKSVHKALEVMFPRVEALLSQLEDRSLVFHAEPSKHCVPLAQSLSSDATVHTGTSKSPTTTRGDMVSSSTSPVGTSMLTSASASASASPNWDRQPCVYKSSPTQPVYSVSNLIQAAKEGDLKALLSQLDSGIDINSCDSYGNTALYWAAFRGHGHLVCLLLDKGAFVNCRNLEGWTPLHAASRWGLTSCISLLLDGGANIESKTESGRTPLHVAANSGREQSVELLLVEGARINAKDNDGKRPLDLANSSAVRRLLRH
ncbi:E3 ubiquitin-protein ligase Ufd4 [Gryllus bimaculatus]|nr:E3 ubiquitin-protein ligase Ufd4 [Gryllus bimaculatus]